MKYLVVFGVVFCVLFSFAQTGTIKGKIVESITNQHKDYVAVKLFKSNDTIVQGIIYTDENGVFVFENLPFGNYTIRVNEFGYEDFSSEDILLTTEQPIVNQFLKLVKAKTDELEEVVIRQEKMLIENNLEKRTYNVSQDIMSKGASASDLLNNIPSIDVDQDGNITLRGESNIIILIDGKPSTISGGNARTIFESIPAESIDRIEIVNNPSAKYDADGTAGFINIVMKKNRVRGINGNFSLSAGTANVYNATGALSYMTDKMNAFASYGFRYYEGVRGNDVYQRRENAGSVMELFQKRVGSDLMENHTFRLGSDFYLPKSNTLGFYVTGIVGDRERDGDMINRQFQNDSIKRDWVRRTAEPSSNYGFDFNLNYLKRFKENTGSVSAEITHSMSSLKTEGNYLQQEALFDYYLSMNEDLYQRLLSDEKNRTTTFQIDAVKKFRKGMTLEFGEKSIIRQFDLVTNSTRRLSSDPDYYQDTIADYDYVYNEQIHTLYGNWKHVINKFSYTAGVRLEYFEQRPNLKSQNLSYLSKYYNLFPSLALSYKLNDKSDITLQFSRRINRPSSEQLNPFVSYTDPLNLRTGNPYLKPEFINAVELSYNYNTKNFSVMPSLYFRQASNAIQRVRWYTGENITTSSYDNVDGSRTFGYELIVIYKPFKWFKNMLSSNGSYIQFIENNDNINWNRKGVNWSVKYSGTFDFWKNSASVQLNARYFSPIIMAQGQGKGRAVVDLAFNKTLKNKNWSIGARLSDVFNTQEFTVIIDQPGIYQTSRFKQNTRRLYVTVTYKFGKYEVSKKSQLNNTSGGEGEN